MFKYGTTTGLTSGTITHIIADGDQDGKGADGVICYVLKISWDSLANPFAAGGDSGSLVFAKEGDIVIPLGIHCGSSEMSSYALSLWSICEKISDSLDADLFFCDIGECGREAGVDVKRIFATK